MQIKLSPLECGWRSVTMDGRSIESDLIGKVTGNGNGLAGFALSKAKASLKTIKNRAGQRLMYIPTYKEHTVLHDFFTQFENIKIFVKKIHEG
ncbi:28S ribosomal protein S5, mitochondrial-like [Camponotus floridanus]|uniref:28S ribosomal protein S5, mitochondrial-like n=1 Tax=Camponotus floridanus TaxID=104421 RepID=UPI000DC69E77|nr:28S ribosomal protein S5, mitochondrial-like [Camponotus floridanus]